MKQATSIFLTAFLVFTVLILVVSAIAIDPVPSDAIGGEVEIDPSIGDAAAGASENSNQRSAEFDAIDRTLLPEEREAYEKDANSHGWNETDRAFLNEHGVSESEARAIETILRENGVE